jgi:hypothetical protein
VGCGCASNWTPPKKPVETLVFHCPDSTKGETATAASVEEQVTERRTGTVPTVAKAKPFTVEVAAVQVGGTEPSEGKAMQVQAVAVPVPTVMPTDSTAVPLVAATQAETVNGPVLLVTVTG